jgi:hypothetical protein
MKMVFTMKDIQLTKQFRQQLPSLLPANFTVDKLREEVASDTRNRSDLQATLKTPTRTFSFSIEVKNADRVAPMREAALQAKRYAVASNTIPMVAGVFLGDKTREALKQEGVGYIDLAGNFYLKQPNFYAERIIDRNPFSNTPPLKNLFAPISSRITRALLIEPKRSWTISELAKETEVSLGQTYNAVEALAEEELVVKSAEGKWVLVNPTALLEAWKKVYPSYQARKYSFFSYESDKALFNSEVIRVGEQAKLQYALGFFSGADLVAPYIRGLTKVQLYTTETAIEQWKRDLKLKEVQSSGNVELYIPYDAGVFYKTQVLPRTQGTVPVVSNVQLYMDLFNNPARGEEAAEHLRETTLGF